MGKTKLKPTDEKTLRMWIAVSPYGYVFWDVMNPHKGLAREALVRGRGMTWEEFKAEGWELVKTEVRYAWPRRATKARKP